MNDSHKNEDSRILIIDDNKHIYEDFCTILINDTGLTELDAIAADFFDEEILPAPAKNYSLDYAPQGKEGVEKIRRALAEGRPFALSFVDMRMPPGWDGLKTIENIWKVDPNIQVVICTAYSDYSWNEIIRRIGPTDKLLILKKPFDNAEVAQLACALTEKWRLAKQASIKMSEIEQIVINRTRELEITNDKLQSEISERQTAVKALWETNTALQKSLKVIKSTQNQLVQSEKMAALGSLVAGVAHEINTPLGVGITAASFLKDKTAVCQKQYIDDTMRRSDLEKYIKNAAESSDMILTNLNRAADLVRSFKQVAVDQSTGECREFNLKDYIDKLLFSLRPRYKRTQHSITVQCPKDLEIVSFPGIFSQIITNLVMNSLIHGFEKIEKGNIQINVWVDGRWLVLCYTDDGKGMDQETLAKIFDPFFTTNRSHGGTGLGMHILYNLVTQSLGGEMDCMSTPNKGVVFIIRIPL